MLEFNREKINQSFQREGWHNHEIEAMISLLDKVTDRLQKPFNEWLDHQAVSDEPLVEGLSRRTHHEVAEVPFFEYFDRSSHPDLAKQYKNLFQSAEVNE